MLKAGNLTRRVALQSPVETRDAHGGFIQTWVTYAARWAEIEPASGQEYVSGEQTTAIGTHKITIRWDPGISPNPTHRILLGTRVFGIVHVQDVREGHRAWELLAKELESLPQSNAAVSGDGAAVLTGTIPDPAVSAGIPLAQDLIAAWIGDQANPTDNIFDQHENALHLTQHGNPAANGIYRTISTTGGGYADRASESLLQLGNSPFTFELIVAPQDAGNGTGYFFRKQNEVGVYDDGNFSGNNLHLDMAGSQIVNGPATPFNLCHIVVRSTGPYPNTAYMTVDGVGYSAGGPPITANANPFVLGNSFKSFFFYNLRFWKRNLPDSDVAWLYNGGNFRSYGEILAA